MTLKLVQAGDPVLRQSARPLTEKEIRSSRISDLISGMREAMRGAPGVGLAAPQVGYGLQLAVIEDRPEYMKDFSKAQLAERERQPAPFQVLINPRLTIIGDERREFFEGCLSLPGLVALVPRARSVRVECLDENGRPKVIEASGWYARILQHEFDHLQGAMYVDRMHSRSLATVDNYNAHWRPKTLEKIRKELRLS